jgi:hypothetical protein
MVNSKLFNMVKDFSSFRRLYPLMDKLQSLQDRFPASRRLRHPPIQFLPGESPAAANLSAGEFAIIRQPVNG